MISPARSTTVAWASIKAVSLVAMAPGSPELPLRHRHGRGLNLQAPGGDRSAGCAGPVRRSGSGGRHRRPRRGRPLCRQIIGQQRQDPVGRRRWPEGPGNLAHVPDKAVVRGHQGQPAPAHSRVMRTLWPSSPRGRPGNSRKRRSLARRAVATSGAKTPRCRICRAVWSRP